MEERKEQEAYLIEQIKTHFPEQCNGDPAIVNGKLRVEIINRLSPFELDLEAAPLHFYYRFKKATDDISNKLRNELAMIPSIARGASA